MRSTGSIPARGSGLIRESLGEGLGDRFRFFRKPSPTTPLPVALDIVPRTNEHRKAVTLPVVEAHITGTVWKIEVEVGDQVQEGDTVVILESMKMEMPVEAEDPGVVTEITVQEGQSVSEGDPLVVLD
jgi:acetyl-CoA carboxylase biotin carboxyl carrier protein